MALVTTDFNVNITPGAMPPVVHVSEYDIGRSYTVGLIGENDDTFTIPTGTTVTIEGTLNGAVGFSAPATISNNKVAFTLTESMTAYAGKAWCKIKLTLNDEPIQTCAFVLAVDRAGVEAETVIGAPGFEEQIQQGAENYLSSNPEAVNTALAEYFDENPPTVPGYLPEVDATDNGKILSVKNGAWTDTEDYSVKKITPAELETASDGVYTLGVVTLTAPIQFSRVSNRGIVIVNTVFNINTPVLFPAFRDDTYFSTPCFIGCTFNNVYGDRVLVTSGSNDLVGNRYTGCNFNNVDCAESVYLQDFNFVNCYIRSFENFLNCPTSTVQARFVNCDVEAQSKAIVNASKALIYASGTYEGNAQQAYYFFNAVYGTFTFDAAWLEAVKLLHLTGGTVVKEQSTIILSGCEVQIGSTPQVSIDNPGFVNLIINGSFLVPFNNQARFIDKTAEQLMSVTGDFTASSIAGYVKPIGGVLAEDRRVATLFDVNTLESKRFFYQQITLSKTVIQAGGVDITLPVGAWLIVVGRGGGGYSVARVQLVSAETNPAYTTTSVLTVIPTTPSNDGYVGNLVLTATKANAADVTFTLNINSSNDGYAASFKLSAIRLY